MTLVEDVIGYLEDDYPGGLPSDVELINGADSETTDGERSREGALARANLVTVKPANPDTPTPVGTEYDHKRGDPVDVTVEGLHEDQRGYVTDHAGFSGLVGDVKTAVLTNREFPTTSTDARYYDLVIENEADQSRNFRDYYRYDFTVRFRGYDDLP